LRLSLARSSSVSRLPMRRLGLRLRFKWFLLGSRMGQGCFVFMSGRQCKNVALLYNKCNLPNTWSMLGWNAMGDFAIKLWNLLEPPLDQRSTFLVRDDISRSCGTPHNTTVTKFEANARLSIYSGSPYDASLQWKIFLDLITRAATIATFTHQVLPYRPCSCFA
jgi:hypothetical protein